MSDETKSTVESGPEISVSEARELLGVSAGVTWQELLVAHRGVTAAMQIEAELDGQERAEAALQALTREEFGEKPTRETLDSKRAAPLAEALRARLDEELKGKESELEAAVAAIRRQVAATSAGQELGARLDELYPDEPHSDAGDDEDDERDES